MDISYNELWAGKTPLVSVITAVYNNEDTLLSAMSSIKGQTFQDLEYIVVNDGSTQNLDSIVQDFMGKVDFPMCYIKKENGGVHTARNCAIKFTRGKLLLILDGDDEFVPDALEEFLKAWNQIPKEKVDEYREVVALCKNEKGKQIGIAWPEDINQRPWEEIDRVRKLPKYCSEHTALMRCDLMRSHPWPEAEGVTFVRESLLWKILDKKYKKWYLNKCLRIYHTNSVDSLSKRKKRSVQHCINELFQCQYLANNYSDYELGIKSRFMMIMRHEMYRQVLRKKDSLPEYEWVREGLTGWLNNTMSLVARFPAVLLAECFINKRME